MQGDRDDRHCLPPRDHGSSEQERGLTLDIAVVRLGEEGQVDAYSFAFVIVQAGGCNAALPALTRSLSCGQYLRWIPSPDEEAGGFYEVLHGERFEQAFDAMRRKKRMRKDGSKSRPFSGMHKVSTLSDIAVAVAPTCRFDTSL